MDKTLNANECSEVKRLSDRLFELHDAWGAAEYSRLHMEDRYEPLSAMLAETIGSYLSCVADEGWFNEETFGGLLGNLRGNLKAPDDIVVPAPAAAPTAKARAVIASLELLRDGANALMRAYVEYDDPFMFNKEAGLCDVMPGSCDEWILTIDRVIEKLSHVADPPHVTDHAYLDSVGTPCGANNDWFVKAWHLGPDSHPRHCSGNYFVLDQEDGTYELCRLHRAEDGRGLEEPTSIARDSDPHLLVDMANKVMR